MPQFTVRRATADDAKTLIDLVNTVAAQEEWLGIDRFPLSLEQETQFLHTADPAIYLSLIATDALGATAGVLTASRGVDPKLAHVSRLALAVSPKHRRLGVGRGLLAAMEDWAHSYGVERSTLSVLSRNTVAIALFNAAGFREEARFVRQYRLRDDFVDELWMVRWLSGEVGSDGRD